MLQKSNNPRNNTGHQGISLQRVPKKYNDCFAVMATTVIDNTLLTKKCSINKYGLKEAMRLAITKYYEWHGKDVSVDALDFSKAKDYRLINW